jgi:hypothetical protein
MVNILRYPDIMKTIFKKNISELSNISSYKHFKIQLSVENNLNQYLRILQYLSIYIGNLPNSQYTI